MACERKRGGPSRVLMSKVYVDIDSRMRLSEYCRTGHSSAVRKMLRKAFAFDVNQRDEKGQTLIHLAASGGHYDVVSLLIECGADVNVINTIAVTPLHMAVKAGDNKTVKCLVLAGADVNARDANDLRPVDYCDYYTDMWKMLKDAATDIGLVPPMDNAPDTVAIPSHIIPIALLMEEQRRKKEEEAKEKKAKKKKNGGGGGKGKKGKKGKKKGKKKKK